MDIIYRYITVMMSHHSYQWVLKKNLKSQWFSNRMIASSSEVVRIPNKRMQNLDPCSRESTTNILTNLNWPKHLFSIDITVEPNEPELFEGPH